MRIRDLNWALLVVAVCGPLSVRGTAQDRPAPEVAESTDQESARRERGRSPQRGDQDSDVGPNRATGALPAMIELLEKEKDGQVRWLFSIRSPHWGTTRHRRCPRSWKPCDRRRAAGAEKRRTRIIVPRLALAAIGKPAVEGLRGLLKEREGKCASRSRHELGANRARRRSRRPRPDRFARRQE